MSDFQLPPILSTSKGTIRHVGFELEYSGLELASSAALVAEATGGIVEEINPWYFLIKETAWGNFSLVLDFQFLINSGLHQWLQTAGFDSAIDTEVIEAIENFLGTFSASLVPYELATPPLPIDRPALIETLKDRLRTAGAIGTASNPLYVFGFHINPEVPRQDIDTILAYMQAFLLLYEYLVERIKPNLTRRLSPYIDPFGTEYIMMVLAPVYRPSIAQFIDDYLEYNPTRNRALDLLPLLAKIDLKRVRKVLPDEKINPRPTFHFRMPNSRVDDPAWHTFDPWNSWILVERLANDRDTLRSLCYERYKMMESPFYMLDKTKWLERIHRWAEHSA